MTETTVETSSVVNTVKQKLRSSKNTVVKHRAKIAVVVTSAAWIALQIKVMKAHNTFLEEHGLLDEFYGTEDDPAEAAAIRGN